MIRVPQFDDPAIRHGYFTREGGVSEGIFASMNCSLGSGDDVAKVTENRRIAMAALGLTADRLVTCHQVHGADVVTVERPWAHEDRPRADAMMTQAKGIVLGILTADCAPVLFADAKAGIVAAAHAGWRGAVTGVIETTIEAMVKAGAARARIAAAVGPCIGKNSYEVGAEFPAPFMAQSADNAAFFHPAAREDHYMFDLPGYARTRLVAAGIVHIGATGGDTCGEPARFFSYRRMCLTGEKHFGHLLSAICLAP